MTIYKGSCLCGAIHYEVTGDPEEPGLCHCSMCRKAHGSPFGVYSRVLWENFRLIRGKEQLKSYQSSDGIERTFCADCGSNLQFIRKDRDGFGLAIGTLDTTFTTEPTVQIFAGDKAPWWPLQAHPASYETWD